MSGLDYERLVLASEPIGFMRTAFDTTLSYIKERKQFCRKFGEFQLMQAKLAKMYTKLQSSREILYSLIKIVDESKLLSLNCASIIHYTSKCSTEVALESIQALGGNGYINEYPTGICKIIQGVT
jgi:isovaleryl-CoA dehydrogenase